MKIISILPTLVGVLGIALSKVPGLSYVLLVGSIEDGSWPFYEAS